MSHISVYLNSKASGGNIKWVKEVQKQLFRHDLLVKAPSSKEELDIELEKDIQNKVEHIFSVGGDGTANCILQKIAKTDIKLLIIPCGTANDLANEIGMGSSIKSMIKAFQHKTYKRVDLIEINGKYMATNGGIGCAADVAGKINAYRAGIFGFKGLMKNMGSSVYPLVFTKELLVGSLKQYNLKVKSSEFSEIVKTPLLLINNQSNLAGKFLVAPHTRNNDGKFNVTIFKHQNKKDFLKCALKILSGSYPYADKNLISFETDSIEVSEVNGDKLPFFGDGEILNQNSQFKIQAHEKAFNVCALLDDVDYSSSYDLAQVRLV
ncbi:MAG: hypothetical protein CME64_09715 [Halobacteriovoraceae bacterium]|nr:hypothetical protein [Halobacteriovoraceae bacterium]